MQSKESKVDAMMAEHFWKFLALAEITATYISVRLYNWLKSVRATTIASLEPVREIIAC